MNSMEPLNKMLMDTGTLEGNKNSHTEHRTRDFMQDLLTTYCQNQNVSKPVTFHHLMKFDRTVTDERRMSRRLMFLRQHEVKNYSDIFGKGFQTFNRISVTSDSDIANSSFCHGITFDWCLKQCNNLFKNTDKEDNCPNTNVCSDKYVGFSDTHTLQKYDFLFLLKPEECDLETMVCKSCVNEHLPKYDKVFIKYLLQNKRCLLVVDGYQEPLSREWLSRACLDTTGKYTIVDTSCREQFDMDQARSYSDKVIVNLLIGDGTDDLPPTVYTVQATSFRTYLYTRKHVSRLTYDYRDILETLNVTDTKHNHSCDDKLFGDVYIQFLCLEQPGQSSNIEGLSEENGWQSEKSAGQRNCTKDILKPEVYIAAYHDAEHAKHLYKTVLTTSVDVCNAKFLVLVLGDGETCSDKNVAVSDHFIRITKRKHVMQSIDSLLERYALKYLKEQALNLQFFLLSTTLNTTSHASQNSQLQHQLYGTLLYLNGLEYIHQSQGILGALERTQLTDLHMSKVAEHVMDVKELLSEIAGMFERSKIPKSERLPESDEQLEVGDMVVSKLADIKGTVGCGYRFGVLNVFIDKTIYSTRKSKMKEKITDILNDLGIRDFKFCVTSKSMEKLMACEVGTRISGVDTFATLGGFVEDGDRSLHGLMSRHVAKRFIESSPDQSNNLMNETNEKIGEIVEPGGGPLDIAVAKITTSTYNTKLKSSDGNPSACRMVDFDSGDLSHLRKLRGMPVHIWGSVSRPGCGKITIPSCSSGDAKVPPYVIVEDYPSRKGHEPIPFSRPGDSGAIVSGDSPVGDFVHAISMVQGRKIVKEDPDGRTNTPRTQYQTERLQSGLTQVSRHHKCTFRLTDQEIIAEDSENTDDT